MKILILTLLLALSALPVIAQTDSRVVRLYDRFEDRTRYWTRPTYVQSGLDLTAHFTFKGKGAGKDVDGFYLIFTSVDSDWRFIKDSRLYFLVDGERIDLGSSKWNDQDVKSGYRSVEVKEVLMFPVKYQTLQKIAQAKQVEVRLGSAEFRLDQYFRESLKELLGKVSVVKKK